MEKTLRDFDLVSVWRRFVFRCGFRLFLSDQPQSKGDDRRGGAGSVLRILGAALDVDELRDNEFRFHLALLEERSIFERVAVSDHRLVARLSEHRFSWRRGDDSDVPHDGEISRSHGGFAHCRISFFGDTEYEKRKEDSDSEIESDRLFRSVRMGIRFASERDTTVERGFIHDADRQFLHRNQYGNALYLYNLSDGFSKMER